MVDHIISKLDFSIHDLTHALFDAMHMAQDMPIAGPIKKRVVLAAMHRLTSRLNDANELNNAKVLLDTFPSVIDMTIAMCKNRRFKRRSCCLPLLRST